MKTVNERPLLDPSPRTPNLPPPPPPASELPGPLPEPPLRNADDGAAAQTSNNPYFFSSSSHRRNASSGRSRGSRDDAGFPPAAASVFPRSGSSSSSHGAGRPPTAVRYGSRAESDRYGSSLKEIPDQDARLVYVGDPDRTATVASSSSSAAAALAGNSIRTSKYSVLTFLPRNLFEQFHRVAYIYFLVIAVLNQLPMLAVFGRGASILPLAFVLLVTAIKDGYEDFRRHRSDRMENNREAMVLMGPEGGGGGALFQPKRWRDIRVGEVIKVRSNETLPCDIVLLATSDPTGVAYVQTINLDGESNLKTRYAKQETQNRWKSIIDTTNDDDGSKSVSSSSTALFPPPALIRCERPNRNIYGFLANLEIDSKRASLGPSNIVLRGCELKNTAWAVGVAVYAGRDTKVMLNSSGAPSKRSRLETHMNRETISLSAILVLMCSIVAILHGIWTGNHKDELDYSPYFRKKQFYGDDPSETNVVKNYNYYGIAAEVVFAFLMSVIVFQIMIPISLYISMELVRLGQAYFMIHDQNLYDESSNSRFQCRALNINEDLGQIKYVFSDKTGTLTENKMVFQRPSIGGVDYQNGGGEEDTAAAPPGKYNNNSNGFYVLANDGTTRLRPKKLVKTDPELVNSLRNREMQDDKRAKYAYDFMLALATCNTIVPLLVDTLDPAEKLIDYQGESPDEQALVYAAASYGFVLVERTSGHIEVDVLGSRRRFNVLGLHEFDSDRKRMSVIVGCPDSSVKLFVKGADSSMLSVLDESLDRDVISGTKSHLAAYSNIGLRTLVIGMKDLSAADYQSWLVAYQKASTALYGRAKLLREVAANIERNLRVLGATGIEDKLQQGVPEAIESLRIAGMKVWVLTGDKQETAISIGMSCKLLTPEMRQIKINCNSKDSCKSQLERAITSIRTPAISGQEGSSGQADRVPLGLIIDGTSLVYILETDLEQKLFELATACDVVLCCRVAPLQKAGIVALIKNGTDDMSLAIGDGANDVSMIQMADVGIGISGQEGRQAVMASDFAMGQFRFLVPLLLVHGHWNYQRMAYMILYNFYRNSVFVFQLFWFVLYTAFTLSVAISEWSSVLYSIIYTALPTIVVGVLDKDLGRKTLLKNPQLYGAGQREESYNMKLFVLTMLDSLWQSAVIFFVPYFVYRHTDMDIFSFGDVLVLAVVLLVNIHLAMDVFRWYWITHVAIWGCVVATLICVIVLDSIPDLPGYWAIFHILGTRRFWACLFGILVIGMLPRFIVKAAGEYFWPNDIQIAREFEKSSRSREAVSTEVEMITTTNDHRTISR